MSAANDIKRGKDALVYFHNASLEYPAGKSRTFDGLIAELSKKNPAFLEGFGFAISVADVNEAAIQSAMQGLAEEGQGKLPVRWMAFFDAVQGKAGQVDFLDAFLETASETAKDVGAGFQRAGEAAQETLKSAEGLAKYIPYLAIGALVLYGYVFVKGASKAAA